MITFGIWPGVVASDLEHFKTPIPSPPEDVDATVEALRELTVNASRFYVRCYRGHPDAGTPPTPADPHSYVGAGRVVDLVVEYNSQNAEEFARSMRAAVHQVAGLGGGKLQVCEEVNAAAPQDGGRAGCYEALAAGLAAALDERDQLGADVLVGFNAAAALPAEPFWQTVQTHFHPAVLRRVDYLGLDFFPGVFRPIPPSELHNAVAYLVRSFREAATRIDIPHSTPIHITETGWPTGSDHSEHEQAHVIGTVAETVIALADETHLDTYEIFGLRDGHTDGPRMNRFGLLRADYQPKPAFETAKHLVAQHSQ